MSSIKTMRTATPQPANGDPPRIVIVDDQPVFRQAARHLLEARGYEAGCAATALDAVDRHAPDAMLLEVRLGEEDGFAVCGTLTRTRPGLAVLLASDGDYEHARELIARSGARGFVRKSRLPQIDLDQFWPRA